MFNFLKKQKFKLKNKVDFPFLSMRELEKIDIKGVNYLNTIRLFEGIENKRIDHKYKQLVESDNRYKKIMQIKEFHNEHANNDRLIFKSLFEHYKEHNDYQKYFNYINSIYKNYFKTCLEVFCILEKINFSFLKEKFMREIEHEKEYGYIRKKLEKETDKLQLHVDYVCKELNIDIKDKLEYSIKKDLHEAEKKYGSLDAVQ